MSEAGRFPYEDVKKLPDRARVIYDAVYKSVYSAYKEGTRGKTTPEEIAHLAAMDAARREMESGPGAFRPRSAFTQPVQEYEKEHL